MCLWFQIVSATNQPMTAFLPRCSTVVAPSSVHRAYSEEEFEALNCINDMHPDHVARFAKQYRCEKHNMITTESAYLLMVKSPHQQVVPPSVANMKSSLPFVFL